MLRAKNTFLITAAAAALSVSCSHKSPNDQTIITDIQAKLYADALTKPASVAVTVQNGTVTLSGDVPSSEVALEAMKIAKGAAGVHGVNDKMTINGTTAATQLPNAGSPAASTGTASQEVSNAAPPNSPPAPTPPPPTPVTVTFPAGEHLQVRTIDAINSATAEPGQVFRASLNAPLVREGRVIIPAGSPVSLIVAAARAAGHVKGQSELEVRASSIDDHGRRYRIDTSIFEEEGKARGKQTAVRTGVGAVAGAVIGAIAGGGKGAAIGSAAGGGVGFGSDLFTHGQQVKIPSETILMFRLEAPLQIEP